MQKSKILIILGVLLIAVGAGGFFAGMKYQQSKQPSVAQFRGAGRQGTGIQRPEGSNVIRGEIIDKDEASMTVKLADESSKIVLISENTAINKATEGSVDDLETGEQVMVFGQTNADGSISAQNIQLNPSLDFLRFR